MMMHLGRTIRCYANKFSLPTRNLSAERFTRGARSYSSGYFFRVPALSIGESIAGGVSMGWLCYWLDLGGQRTNIDVYLENTRRSKFESVKAELEFVERKIDAFKAKLQESRAGKDHVPKGVSCTEPAD